MVTAWSLSLAVHGMLSLAAAVAVEEAIVLSAPPTSPAPMEIDIELENVPCLMLVFDGDKAMGNWADARVINEAESD